MCCPHNNKSVYIHFVSGQCIAIRKCTGQALGCLTRALFVYFKQQRIEELLDDNGRLVMVDFKHVTHIKVY